MPERQIRRYAIAYYLAAWGRTYGNPEIRSIISHVHSYEKINYGRFMSYKS